MKTEMKHLNLYIHQSIMTKIKNSASGDWIVIETAV